MTPDEIRFRIRFPNPVLYTHILIRIKDFLRDLGAVAAGVHGQLFNAAVGLGLGEVRVLHQAALGPAHQTDLGNFVLQAGVLLPQALQAVVAGGGHVHGLHK